MGRFTGGVLLVVTVLITVGLYAMSGPWFNRAAEPARTDRPRDEFAADRAPVAAPVKEVPFDAKRAMGYLTDLCKIGPRISGEAGMAKQQEMLKKHFEALGGRVTLQSFKATQVSRPRQPVEMANMIISWHPDRKRRVIVCSHYDTRPIADQEPDVRKWREPFVSANDGGSGVAFLMELAHAMKDLPTEVGVDFVLFDGEEYIHERGDRYFFGSRYFASDYLKNRGDRRYVGAILLDMIAGKNARIPMEWNSLRYAGALIQEIWKIAEEQHCPMFVNQTGDRVEDDHLALNGAGIPAIDLIDFSYPHWHRLTDVPENCSEDSMAQVARVLGVWLQRVK
jgi:hypothetical protein